MATTSTLTARSFTYTWLMCGQWSGSHWIEIGMMYSDCHESLGTITFSVFPCVVMDAGGGRWRQNNDSGENKDSHGENANGRRSFVDLWVEQRCGDLTLLACC